MSIICGKNIVVIVACYIVYELFSAHSYWIYSTTSLLLINLRCFQYFFLTPYLEAYRSE